MLSEIRQALVTDLETVVTVPVLDTWTLPLEPPCVIVVPALNRDYVTAGQFPGSYVVSLDAVAVVPVDPNGSRQAEQEALDAITEEIVTLKGWALQGVSGTALMTFGALAFPSISIQFSIQE
jgi:hypothetical protein